MDLGRMDMSFRSRSQDVLSSECVHPGVIMLFLMVGLFLSLLHPAALSRDLVDRYSPTIDIVVSLCNETKDTLLFLEERRSTLSKFYIVSVIYYCKCGHRDECNFILPNLGRESHTFFWHLESRYHKLSDLTVFLNGGIMSKSHVKEGLDQIVDELSKFERSEYYFRKYVNFRSAYIDRMLTSWNTTLESEFKESVSVYPCVAEVPRFCESSARCNIDDFSFCEERCGCDRPKACRWAGLSDGNNAFSNVTLPRASDFERGVSLVHNIYSWACARFQLSPDTIDRCGYTYGAVFAVGSLRLKEYPRSVYSKLVSEYARYGPTGGVAGHYMERLYRSVFHCSLMHD